MRKHLPPGNIAVFVAAASASNTTGSIVELNPTSSNQSAVNTYSINGTSGGSDITERFGSKR